MTVATLNPAEEAQLTQTIEMFEVIVQSQPNDCQSLEILKEAYTKLGREPDVIRISKRIAEAYTQMGQLSSAILEYETVLQRQPNDVEVQPRSGRLKIRPAIRRRNPRRANRQPWHRRARPPDFTGRRSRRRMELTTVAK